MQIKCDRFIFIRLIDFRTQEKLDIGTQNHYQTTKIAEKRIQVRTNPILTHCNLLYPRISNPLPQPMEEIGIPVID